MSISFTHASSNLHWLLGEVCRDQRANAKTPSEVSAALIICDDVKWKEWGRSQTALTESALSEISYAYNQYSHLIMSAPADTNTNSLYGKSTGFFFFPSLPCAHCSHNRCSAATEANTGRSWSNISTWDGMWDRYSEQPNTTVVPPAQDTGGRLTALWAAISLLPLTGIYFSWSERRGNNTSSGVQMSAVSQTKRSFVCLQAATYLCPSVQETSTGLTETFFYISTHTHPPAFCRQVRQLDRWGFRPKLLRWRRE